MVVGRAAAVCQSCTRSLESTHILFAFGMYLHVAVLHDRGGYTLARVSSLAGPRTITGLSKDPRQRDSSYLRNSTLRVKSYLSQR